MDFASWHRDLLDPSRGHEVPPWAGNRTVALEVFESVQPPRAKQAETSELARLRAEVATLRGDIKRLRLQHAKDIKTLNANFAQLNKLADTLFGTEKGDNCVVGNVLDRIERLEQRQPNQVTLPSANDVAAACRSGPVMCDRGVWYEHERYQAGDVVTVANALWIATVANRGLKPGNTAVWRLAHKTELGFVRKLIREELARQKGIR